MGAAGLALVRAAPLLQLARGSALCQELVDASLLEAVLFSEVALWAAPAAAAEAFDEESAAVAAAEGHVMATMMGWPVMVKNSRPG